MSSHLGKITKVKLGKGGYQDAMFGVTFHFEFGGNSIQDFRGDYPNPSTPLNLLRMIMTIMDAAKVTDFNDLVGTPVRIHLKGQSLESWEVLREVL